MKSASGYIELVVLLSLLVGSLPLIVSLVTVASTNNYTYMTDKSVVSMNSYIDYREIDHDGDGTADYIVPEKYGSFTINPSAAVLLTIVNDDFCPDQGRNISYRFNGNGIEGFGFIEEGDITDPSLKYELNITDGWISKKFNSLVNVINNVEPDVRNYYDGDQKLHLCWDPNLDKWVIQDNYVYIWEMR